MIGAQIRITRLLLICEDATCEQTMGQSLSCAGHGLGARFSKCSERCVTRPVRPVLCMYKPADEGDFIAHQI